MPLYLFYIGELVDSICPKSFNRIQKTQCGIINPCWFKMCDFLLFSPQTFIGFPSILDRSGGATAQYPGGAVATLSTPGLCRGSQSIGEAVKDTQWRLMEMAKDCIFTRCLFMMLMSRIMVSSGLKLKPPTFVRSWCCSEELEAFYDLLTQASVGDLSVVQQSKWWRMHKVYMLGT